MDSTFELEVATPERAVFQRPVREAQVPARSGYLGILPGHAPLIGELGTGVLTCVEGSGTRSQLVISRGFLQIDRTRVLLLADVAELPSEINASRAEAQLHDAESRSRSAQAGTDYDAALNDLELAKARLAIAR
jgi:F-type H+-transporting ATPase subunit epsilon